MGSLAFETSGKVKYPSEVELDGCDKDTAILAYTNGTMADGRPYYAYVAVKPSRYKEFYALTLARKPMVLSDYGAVITAGFSAEPPPEVVKVMRERYGFDDRFEEKLKKGAEKQQTAFMYQQEEKRLNDIVVMLKRKKPDNNQFS